MSRSSPARARPHSMHVHRNPMYASVTLQAGQTYVGGFQSLESVGRDTWRATSSKSFPSGVLSSGDLLNAGGRRRIVPATAAGSSSDTPLDSPPPSPYRMSSSDILCTCTEPYHPPTTRSHECVRTNLVDGHMRRHVHHILLRNVLRCGAQSRTLAQVVFYATTANLYRVDNSRQVQDA